MKIHENQFSYGTRLAMARDFEGLAALKINGAYKIRYQKK
jgi:hypothetical protein